MQPMMRIACRCTGLLLPRALSMGQTGRQTNGRTHGHGDVLRRFGSLNHFVKMNIF